MSKTKVLLVDDEEKFGRMVKSNLEKEGQYEVQVETKGAQALSSAKLFKPNVILMDMMMPDLGGCEAAAQIRSDEKLKNIPIVFLTALAKKNETELYGGVVDGRPFIAKPVIAKPIKTKDLIKCIEENLANPLAEAPPG